MAYDALSIAAAGNSSRAPSSLRMLLAGLAVGPPLRHASLHSSTSAAACSTYRQCCNDGHSPHHGSPDDEAPDLMMQCTLAYHQTAVCTIARRSIRVEELPGPPCHSSTWSCDNRPTRQLVQHAGNAVMHMLCHLLTQSLLGCSCACSKVQQGSHMTRLLTLLSCNCPLVQTASRLMPPGTPFEGAQLIAFSVNSSFARCSTACNDQTHPSNQTRV